jgi:hypothetical protein
MIAMLTDGLLLTGGDALTPPTPRKRQSVDMPTVVRLQTIFLRIR